MSTQPPSSYIALDDDKRTRSNSEMFPYEKTTNHIILGVNDGLVSMFLLVFGMYGGHAPARSILLAGITGAIAGAISMGLGEYIATKSQIEIFVSDLKRERRNLDHHRPLVLNQLREKLQEMGFPEHLVEQNVEAMSSDDDKLLGFLFPPEEDDEDHRNPLVAMAISACLFIGGALPSVLPFLFIDNQDGDSAVLKATIAAGCACSVVLFLVGSVKCAVTKANWIWGGFENFLYGALGATCSWAVGLIFNRIEPFSCPKL